ncbi:MAG: hypothetical protein JO020_01860 [Chloroflexi bacterium]|nr:hypothetical protein [Chloroflexota bacterium]
MLRRNVWLLAVIALVVLIGEVPHVLAACCAPHGATGFGTAWFVNDFAQYESAMRQGAEQSGWLVHDPFTSEPHPDTFMFPLYVGIGKLAATIGVPALWLEQLTEVLARVLLVLAMWRFCRAFARGREAARWALGLALFASGFELFAGVVGGYTGNWSYELNGFGMLFAAPHVPLAMAATLELARDTLRPHRSARPAWYLKVALLSAVIALLHPFHAPVLLGAAFVAGLAFWRSGRGHANVLAAIVAGLAALPVLLPTVLTFSLQSFWVSTYSVQNLLPSPAPHELLVDLGPTLLLALVGGLLLRGKIAPFGLALWLLLALIAMYIPVPYQRRLAFGIQPAVAVAAANALIGICERIGQRRAAILRLSTVAVAGSSTALVLVSVVASGIANAPLPVYRSTTDLDAATAWLDSHATSADLVLADWDASNYMASRTSAREFGGHPVATLHPDQKRFEIATVFAHPSSLIVAKQLGAQWLVYGPAEAALSGPAEAPAFQSGPVRVYRVA